MKKFLILFLFVSSSCFAAAEQNITPLEFAYGARIKLNNNDSVQRFTIPLTVYEKIISKDLSDIGIFNADNIPAAFTVISPKIEQIKQAQPLQFFPIHNDKTASGNLSLEFTRAEDGSIIVRKHEKEISQKPLSAILIDTRSLNKKQLTEITLDWLKTEETWIRNVILLGSNDLMQWTTLSIPYSLAQLHYNDQFILRNKSPVLNIPTDYVLINFIQPLHLQLHSVNATIINQRIDQYRWTAIKTITREPEQSGYLFTSPNSLPVSAISIELLDKNAAMEFKIYSRQNNKQSWRLRGILAAYDLTLHNQHLSNNILSFPAARDTQWRLVPSRPTGRAFSVKIGWVPEQILFLATGKAPFIFAYGSVNVNNLPDNNNPILKSLTSKFNSDTAALEQTFSLGGDSALKLKPKPTNPQIIMLWSVLLFGLCAVLMMAFTLLKKLKQS